MSIKGHGRPAAHAGAVRIVLPAGVAAPRAAREFLDELLEGCPAELVGRARHLVTELVTNSVTHADGHDIEVEAWTTPEGAVEIVVSDEGPGFDVAPRAAGHDDPDGWGLVFVDLLADSWGTGGHGSPFVWVHLDPRTDVAAADKAVERDPLLDDRVRDLLSVRLLLESVKDYAIFGMDTSGRIAIWNSGAERLTGYRAPEILGLQLAALDDEQPRPTDEDPLATALKYGRIEDERWVRRKDGSRFWADSVLTPIYDSSGALRGFADVMRDVTWRKRLDEDREGLIARIRELARTDELTSLPNRRRWQEELDRELARARRHDTAVCVALVDLDNFKDYNDTHGHLAGDELLRETARRWADALRATDMLARYGGDEFSVVLPDCPLDEALVVMERLRAATPSVLTCSAGVTWCDGSEPAEEAVGRADAALYQAKRDGGNRVASKPGPAA